ncbi:MAG: alpha/beta hydrolase [Candidatus Micrarchaeales archaeon]|nr:alpha/beta hydrolase [Candidatus Micrarchaeales archaeon]
MAKRVFIVHRWAAEATDDYYPWLKDQLEEKGFTAKIVDLPETMDPKPEKWLAQLEKEVGKPDEDTILVGHSLGAQTVMNYLEKDHGARIRGAVLIAHWPRLSEKDKEHQEYIAMSKRWLSREPRWEEIARNTDGVIAIFSDNDPFVPLSDSAVLKRRLNAKIIIEKGKGHFGDVEPAVLELQSALNAVIELSKRKSGKK